MIFFKRRKYSWFREENGWRRKWRGENWKGKIFGQERKRSSRRKRRIKFVKGKFGVHCRRRKKEQREKKNAFFERKKYLVCGREGEGGFGEKETTSCRKRFFLSEVLADLKRRVGAVDQYCNNKIYCNYKSL